MTTASHRNKKPLFSATLPDRIKLILIIAPDKSQVWLVGVHANMVQPSESSCNAPGKQIYHLIRTALYEKFLIICHAETAGNSRKNLHMQGSKSIIYDRC